MDQVKKFIRRDDEFFEFGVNLCMSDSTIERIRTDENRSILMRGWALASRFYRAAIGTKQERLDRFHAALVAIGNADATRFANCYDITHL